MAQWLGRSSKVEKNNVQLAKGMDKGTRPWPTCQHLGGDWLL